jgi:glycosyltransferase involved in cell wall biosynthesis
LKKKILYFTNIFPHYRLAIWKGLLNSKAFDLEIYFSQKNPLGIHSPELKDIFTNNEISKLHLIKNYWVKKKVLIWQSKIIKTALFSEFDYLLLLGEMNVVSSWISIFIAKLRGKKIFMWSHGIYGNESFSKKYLRLLYLKQSDFIFLYENRAKSLLQQNGFNETSLAVVYNSLNYDLFERLYKGLLNTDKNEFITFFKDNSLPTIIFIGRLTKIKRLPVLIEAVRKLNQIKIRYNLLIVGSGEDQTYLENTYNSIVEEGLLHFYGNCFDENKTSELIYHSDLCVSPGNIGLTAIHSLSYGTPVASHSNFNNQMPEVEAIIDGENGFLFEENNSDDLANKIDNWFLNNSNLDKDLSRRIIVEKYNPENQMRIFEKMFSNG